MGVPCSLWCTGAQSCVPCGGGVASRRLVRCAAAGVTFIRSGEDEVRIAVSSGVLARTSQVELRDGKRVLEARTGVPVPSAPSPHRKVGEKEKGEKDDGDELLDLAMNTASEVLITAVKERWRCAEVGARVHGMNKCTGPLVACIWRRQDLL